nr:MAG TPA: hypothetical protein [Crassvirales sp.]
MFILVPILIISTYDEESSIHSDNKAGFKQ